MAVSADDGQENPIQQFSFDADALAVVDYIMGGVDWRRGKQHRIDGLSLDSVNRPWDRWRATLHFIPLVTAAGAEVSIWIDLTHLSSGDPSAPETRRDDLRRTQVGRITLSQTEPARCTALLYPAKEVQFSENKFNEAFRVAAGQIVGQWWHSLISGWKGSRVIDRRIADEVLLGLTREDVFNLVSQFAEVVGYAAVRIFPDDPTQVAQIGLFSRRAMANPDIDTLTPELASVIIQPPTKDELAAKIAQLLAIRSSGGTVKPFTETELERLGGVRVKIRCRTDWRQLPFDVGFPPCHIAADAMRYLLREVEGESRADAWEPLPELGGEGTPSNLVVFLGWDEKALWGHSKLRLSPQRVAQVVEQITLSLGYAIRERYELVGDGWHYVIWHEGEELGRLTVEPAESWPRYFSTSMPQLVGVGKEPVHRKTESINMQPMHPTKARFLDLIEAIHKQLMAEIEFQERHMVASAGATRQPVESAVPLRLASFDEPSDEELALLAKRYGDRLGRNLHGSTIKAWLKIAAHRRRVIDGEVVWLTDPVVIERTAIHRDTYKTYKKDMRKSGFWQDYQLEQESVSPQTHP